jgi:hypothetical protein
MLLHASKDAGEPMEGSPDHIGEEVAENDNTETEPPVTTVAKVSNGVVPAAYHQPASQASNQPAKASNASATTPSPKQDPLPKTGTVVLDADSAMTVPSFIGKPVRTVIEESERAGLELDVFGSGVARQQNPPPGARIPAGGHVTVQFAR